MRPLLVMPIRLLAVPIVRLPPAATCCIAISPAGVAFVSCAASLPATLTSTAAGPVREPMASRPSMRKSLAVSVPPPFTIEPFVACSVRLSVPTLRTPVVISPAVWMIVIVCAVAPAVLEVASTLLVLKPPALLLLIAASPSALAPVVVTLMVPVPRSVNSGLPAPTPMPLALIVRVPPPVWTLPAPARMSLVAPPAVSVTLPPVEEMSPATAMLPPTVDRS